MIAQKRLLVVLDAEGRLRLVLADEGRVSVELQQIHERRLPHRPEAERPVRLVDLEAHDCAEVVQHLRVLATPQTVAFRGIELEDPRRVILANA